MTRADGRGLERLDLNDARSHPRRTRRQPEERRARAGSRQLRAARRRRLSSERPDRPPHRLRHHLQRDGLGAAAPRRPGLSRSRSSRASPSRSTFGFYNRLEQGIPLILGPDQSTGRVAAAECGRHGHAGSRQRRPRHGPDLERRRSSVGCRGMCRRRRVRRRQGRRRLRLGSDVNLPTTYGGGAAEPAVLHHASAVRTPILSWGQRLETDYNSLQVALQPAVHARASCSRAPTRSASR